MFKQKQNKTKQREKTQLLKLIPLIKLHNKHTINQKNIVRSSFCFPAVSANYIMHFRIYVAIERTKSIPN